MLLRGMASRPEARVGELSMLTDGEREELEGWNRTEAEYDRRPVHEQVEEWARQRPGAVALVMGGEELSYGELNRRANRVANRLLELGVGREEIVGVWSTRSLEMGVGLLGVMKAGCAYLPMDPGQPQERLEHMERESGVSVG